ncbi:class I SAM-dependent DNA methyltransferase [Rubrivirga marina]|uniref:Methyltransferase domain-containing protein n=1 Tax=Rubrivirga marina TaxID=1196024 RepID=A0A271IZD0_9BACT|nr:SAM-dependent methyltransferase [Rubrivirga marina]PAP75849.1 hypothetical protein BSZ37_05020 [Rubrivirga marina]
MPNPPPTRAHRTASGSIDPAYFERLYRAEADPWAYATSPYETAKYAATLAALPRDRYASALEVGCSIGVLTERLAPRCGRLLAVDVSEAALARARRRCARLGHVAFERRALPSEAPAGPFDLAVVSEVGYYLAPVDWAEALDRLAVSVGAGGHLVLVHWTGETDYPQTADAVHGAARDHAAWEGHWCHREEAYRVDVLTRAA